MVFFSTLLYVRGKKRQMRSRKEKANRIETSSPLFFLLIELSQHEMELATENESTVN
jgi:hypothetical protein